MSPEEANFRARAAEYNSNDATVTDRYCGRGMGEKTTHGVIVESVPQLLVDVVSYIKEMTLDNETFPQSIPDFGVLRTDNVATRTILY